MIKNQNGLFDSIEESALLTDRDKQVKALDELIARSSTYRVVGNYLSLLQFINRLPSLSPFNAFLIHMQHPGVQFVATAAQWEIKFKRKPKRDARPLVILVPFGPVSFVYDVAETEGDPIPENVLRPFATIGHLTKDFFDCTIENCKRDKIQVYFSDFGQGKAGYARRELDDFSISINNNYSLEDKYSTLAHELGHIYSGQVGTTEARWWRNRSWINKDVKEIEAESISFLVCSRLELQTTSYEYLSTYVKNQKEFPPFSLETVLTVAGYIEQMGRKKLAPRKDGEFKKR